MGDQGPDVGDPRVNHEIMDDPWATHGLAPLTNGWLMDDPLATTATCQVSRVCPMSGYHLVTGFAWATQGPSVDKHEKRRVTHGSPMCDV